MNKIVKLSVTLCICMFVLSACSVQKIANKVTTMPPANYTNTEKPSTEDDTSKEPSTTPTQETKNYIMHNLGEEVAVNKMEYTPVYGFYGPSFGYTTFAGGVKFTMVGGQKLYLYCNSFAKKDWNTTDVEKAYDILITQGNAETTLGSELGTTLGDVKWAKQELTHEKTTVNGKECVKFEGVITSEGKQVDRQVEIKRYVAGYVFTVPYENGDIPSCIIGTTYDKKMEKLEDISEDRKKEVRENVQVMMETLELETYGSITWKDE